MVTEVRALTQKPAWQALANHCMQLSAVDPHRGEKLAVEGAGLYLDFSKYRITDETLKLLLGHAAQCDLRGGSMECSSATDSVLAG